MAMFEQRAVQYDQQPAGSEIRFRVRDQDGRTGSSWKVTTSASNSDVVLAHREGARWVHSTFHDGEWHFAVTERGQALHPEVLAYPLRLPDRQPPPGGMVLAARITVALDELRSGWVERARNRPGLVEIPPTEGYDVVVVDLLLLAPDVGPVNDVSFTVGRLARGGGAGAALLVAHSRSLQEPIRVTFSSAIAKAMDGLRASGWDGSPGRFVIPGHDPVEGYLSQVEFALDRPL